jgi:hypothetical protein
MTTYLKAGVFAVALAMVAGCATGYDDDDAVAAQVAQLSKHGDMALPLCRWVDDQIRGKEVSLYPVRENEKFVGVSDASGPVCVDLAQQLAKFSLTPVSDAGGPSDDWEGTPLPAEGLMELVRKYSAERAGSM